MDSIELEKFRFFKANAKNSDVCLLSKVELVRNFRKIDNLDDQNTVEDLIKLESMLEKIGACKLDFSKNSTLNNHVIYLKSIGVLNEKEEDNESSLFNIYIKDEILIILFYDEDLRIISLKKGYDFINSYKQVLEIEQYIEQVFEYIFDSEIGYITNDLSFIGLGINISTMVCTYGDTIQIKKINELSVAFGLNIKIDFDFIFNIDNFFSMQNNLLSKSNFLILELKLLPSQNEIDIFENFERVLNLFVKNEIILREKEFSLKKYEYLQSIAENRFKLKNSFLISYNDFLSIIKIYMFCVTIKIVEENEFLNILESFLSLNDNYIEFFENDLFVEENIEKTRKIAILRANIVKKLI